jgi:hypothetical protein
MVLLDPKWHVAKSLCLAWRILKLCEAIRNVQKTITIKYTILKFECNMIIEKIPDLMIP